MGKAEGTERQKVETEVCEKLPPEMDEVKSDLKKIFKAILLGLDEGRMPSMADVSRMIELNAEFDEYSADKTWSKEERAFTEKMAEFERTAKRDDLAVAKRLMEELRVAKKACHRDYRWKE